MSSSAVAPPLQLLLSPCRLCLPHGRRSRTVYGPRLLPRYSVLRTTDFSRNLPAQDGYTEVSVLHTAGLSSEVNVLYNRSCCSPHEYFPEKPHGLCRDHVGCLSLYGEYIQDGVVGALESNQSHSFWKLCCSCLRREIYIIFLFRRCSSEINDMSYCYNPCQE